MADREMELVVKFTGKLSDELDQALNKIRSTIQNTVKTGTEPLTHSIDKLTKSKQKTTKAVQEQEHAIGRLTKQFSGLFDSIGSVIKAQIRWYTSQALIFGIVNAVKEAGSAYVELEQKVKNVAAITGATAKDEKILMNAAREAGRTTAVSADEAADSMLMMAQAGYSASESAEALLSVTKAMTVTGDSAATVVDLLTTAMSVWNKSTSDSYEILNELVKGMDATKLTMGDMKTAFSLAAGVAEISNFSMLEFISTLGFLKDRGEKAGTAARGLRQILLQLGKAAEDPSNKLAQRFRVLGIEIEKINPLTNEFNDILKELEKGSFTAADAMNLLPANAAETMIRMLGAANSIEEYNKTIKNAPELNDKFAKAMEGISNQLSKLKNRFQDLFFTIAEEYGQNIQNLIGQLSSLISVFEILLETTPATAEELRKLGKEWAFLASTLEAITSIIKALWIGLKTGTSIILDSLDSTAEGIAITIMLLEDIAKGKGVKDSFSEFWGSVDDSSKKFWDKLVGDTTKSGKELEKVYTDTLARMGTLAGVVPPTQETRGGRRAKTDEELKQEKRNAEALKQFWKQYNDFKIEQTRKASKESSYWSEQWNEKELQMEVDKFETMKNYGADWLEASLALYRQQLLAHKGFKDESVELEKALYEKYNELEAKRIDDQISNANKVATEEDKIRNESLYKKAAEVDTEISLAQKSADARIKVAEDFWERLVALMAKDDLKKPFEQWADFAKSQIDSIANGIGDAFANVIVEGKNLQDELENVWKNIAKSLIRELTNQAIKGIILAFFKSIGDAAKSDSGGESSWWWGLIKAVVGGIAGYFGGGGGGGGGTVETIQVHSGGYVGDVIKSYHSGGLNANETVAKLRTDEYVMGPLATKKIGVDNLNEMNRTGGVPQEQQQQPQPIQIINVTDPNDIPRYLTENPNVVLNIIARDKRYSGQMKEIMANR